MINFFNIATLFLWDFKFPILIGITILCVVIRIVMRLISWPPIHD